ncbi:hypothetical protein L207DRAFT_567456 [Hyaloscypha variabilis F]|uniref:Uncharacterized protein n=1 Tax=Hyaloscypha variabilis (strain UAMH 11265 / GT02V1 / F) TaxID=1149755 RepID=A0A2J6RKU3_HYAVF|nr:hypothetical protein L207DRAFT_567456 [Hyaloscypha variabilis F]
MPHMRSAEIQYNVEENEEKELSDEEESNFGDEKDWAAYDSNHEDESKPKWDTDADDQANKEEVEFPKNAHKAKVVKEKKLYNFDFDAAYFYGDEKNWLLDMVCGFLKDHKNIRGVELLDFYEELEEKTGFKVEEKFSQKELAERLKESMPKII